MTDTTKPIPELRPLRPASGFCVCSDLPVALLPHPDDPTRCYLAYEYAPDGFTPSTHRHICRGF